VPSLLVGLLPWLAAAQPESFASDMEERQWKMNVELMYTIRQGRLFEVATLIDMLGAEVNQTAYNTTNDWKWGQSNIPDWGFSPMHWAVHMDMNDGYAACAPYSCLVEANATRRETIIDWMLDNTGIDLEIKDNDGRTALGHVMLRGHFKYFEKLLERGASLLNAISAENEGSSIFQLMCEKNYVNLTRIVLERGAGDVNERWPEREVTAGRQIINGTTCLMNAALYGQHELAKLMLEWGADDSVENVEQKNALWYTTKSNNDFPSNPSHAETLRILQNTPYQLCNVEFMKACVFQDQPEALRIHDNCYKFDFSFDITKYIYPHGPWKGFDMNTNLPHLTYLFEPDDRLEGYDWRGWTCLQASILYGRNPDQYPWEVTKWALAQPDTDVEYVDADGLTALLHLIPRTNDEDLLRWLLEDRGADPDYNPTNGSSTYTKVPYALFQAAYKAPANLNFTRRLLDNGAHTQTWYDMPLENGGVERWNALEWVVLAGHDPGLVVRELLLERGAYFEWHTWMPTGFPSVSPTTPDPTPNPTAKPTLDPTPRPFSTQLPTVPAIINVIRNPTEEIKKQKLDLKWLIIAISACIFCVCCLMCCMKNEKDKQRVIIIARQREKKKKKAKKKRRAEERAMYEEYYDPEGYTHQGRHLACTRGQGTDDHASLSIQRLGRQKARRNSNASASECDANTEYVDGEGFISRVGRSSRRQSLSVSTK